MCGVLYCIALRVCAEQRAAAAEEARELLRSLYRHLTDRLQTPESLNASVWVVYALYVLYATQLPERRVRIPLPEGMDVCWLLLCVYVCARVVDWCDGLLLLRVLLLLWRVVRWCAALWPVLLSLTKQFKELALANPDPYCVLRKMRRESMFAFVLEYADHKAAPDADAPPHVAAQYVTAPQSGVALAHDCQTP